MDKDFYDKWASTFLYIIETIANPTINSNILTILNTLPSTHHLHQFNQYVNVIIISMGQQLRELVVYNEMFPIKIFFNSIKLKNMVYIMFQLFKLKL